MIDSKRKNFFDTFGYLLLPQIFTAGEMAGITRAADALWDADRATRRTKEGHQHLGNFIEADPRLAWLAEDDRIHDAMTALLGEGFVWGGSEGNTGSFNEAGNHTWHCDRGDDAESSYRRIKIMIYLDPTSRNTGALRVIPGSHQLTYFRALRALNELHPQVADGASDLYGVAGEDLPCVALETRPGDAVIFNHHLYHGVYHKKATRRFVAMKFAARPTTPAHFEALERHHQGASRLHESFVRSERPRVAAMVRPLLRADGPEPGRDEAGGDE